MKNLFLTILALATLSLTTSCEKENLQPENLEAPRLYGPSNGTGNNSAPTWETWNLCEEDLPVSKDQDDQGNPLLTVYDADQNITYLANWLDASECPPGVAATIAELFPGQPVMAHWQTFWPDEEVFLAEIGFADSAEIYLLLMDKSGEVKCKGIRL